MPLSSPDTMEAGSLHTKEIVAALVSALVLLGIGAWLYVGKLTPSTGTQEKHADFNAQLLKKSASYAAAEQLAEQGRFAQALPQYQTALAQAQTGEEREQLELLTARALVQTGSYADAAELLKNIIAVPVTARTARAHAVAVAEIAEIASRGIPAVNKNIFAAEPFKSLWAGYDYALTLRNLYQYAASFYPIAIAELRIADWYAQQLPAQGTATALTAQKIEEYKGNVQTSLAAANQDIAYLREDGSMVYDVRYALLLRATLLGTLAKKGDTSLGDVDAQFKEAIQAYDAIGDGHACRARYAYALFMAQKDGASRKAEIAATLKPLSGQAYVETDGCAFLKEARSSAYARSFVVSVAKLAPDFKQYLMTLGWSSADFSSR